MKKFLFTIILLFSACESMTSSSESDNRGFIVVGYSGGKIVNVIKGIYRNGDSFNWDSTFKTVFIYKKGVEIQIKGNLKIIKLNIFKNADIWDKYKENYTD